MRQEWEPEELVASWTRVADKADATRLGFALLLKSFELEARFARDRAEIPYGKFTLDMDRQLELDAPAAAIHA